MRLVLELNASLLSSRSAERGGKGLVDAAEPRVPLDNAADHPPAPLSAAQRHQHLHSILVSGATTWQTQNSIPGDPLRSLRTMETCERRTAARDN